MGRQTVMESRMERQRGGVLRRGSGIQGGGVGGAGGSCKAPATTALLKVCRKAADTATEDAQSSKHASSQLYSEQLAPRIGLCMEVQLRCSLSIHPKYSAPSVQILTSCSFS